MRSQVCWMFFTALFLAAPMALAANGTGPAEDAQASAGDKALDQLGWKLSCQAYTFRELTLFDTIDTVKKLGIHYIELYPGQRLSKEQPDLAFDHNAPVETVEAVKRKLKEAGVTPVNYGVVELPNDEAGARKVFDFAKRMGLLTIVSEPSAAAMPMLDRLCAEYNINIAIHNHPAPSQYWNYETVLKVVDGRSHRIGSCADTGHWYRSGLVPLEGLQALRGRIVSLHFKDLDAEKHDVPWGTGVLNVPAMLAELKAQGVKPVFSIEYESTTGDELVNNVAKCVSYFKNAATHLVSD